MLSWKNHKLVCVDVFLDNVDADNLDAGEDDDNAVANPVAKMAALHCSLRDNTLTAAYLNNECA